MYSNPADSPMKVAKKNMKKKNLQWGKNIYIPEPTTPNVYEDDDTPRQEGGVVDGVDAGEPPRRMIWRIRIACGER